MDIKIVDHIKETLSETELATERALEIIGGLMERYAKENSRVDTGLMRNSITYCLDGEKPKARSYHASYGQNRNSKGKRYSAGSSKAGAVGVGYYDGQMPKEPGEARSVYVGTNVQYAPYNELGTSKKVAKPFLKPAVVNHINEYKKIISQELKKVSK